MFYIRISTLTKKGQVKLIARIYKRKMPKIDTLDALEEHEEHEDDYQTITNWNANW